MVTATAPHIPIYWVAPPPPIIWQLCVADPKNTVITFWKEHQ